MCVKGSENRRIKNWNLIPCREVCVESREIKWKSAILFDKMMTENFVFFAFKIDSFEQLQVSKFCELLVSVGPNRLVKYVCKREMWNVLLASASGSKNGGVWVLIRQRWHLAGGLCFFSFSLALLFGTNLVATASSEIVGVFVARREFLLRKARFCSCDSWDWCSFGREWKVVYSTLVFRHRSDYQWCWYHQ